MDNSTDRPAINNSTFEDESQIGKAVPDWTGLDMLLYNKKHIQSKDNQFTEIKHPLVYMTVNQGEISSICILLVQTSSESYQTIIYLSSKPVKISSFESLGVFIRQSL